MSKKLLKSASAVSGMTLISRISGLIRDIAFAQVIGSSGSADAFFVAFRIPNFLRRIFGEGAFSQAFVPVLSEYRSLHDQQRIRDFIAQISGRLGAILILITIIGVIAAPVIVSLLAPGFSSDAVKFTTTVDALRITFPYLFFISMVAMAAGVLNSYDQFAAPAITPVILNLALIGAIFWLVPMMSNPTLALATGVLIAGVLQLGFQLPFLKKTGLLVRPQWRRQDDGVGRVFKLMLPAIFGVSIAQINMMVNTVLASFLVTGSVSWLYYSDRLMEFPLGVFGIALATVILPSLSRHHVQDEGQKFSAMLDWGLRWSLLIALPASVGLFILAKPMLITLFYYGAFTQQDVQMSALALQAFASGLLGFILIKVLAPGFFARQDTRTPMRIGVVAMVVNVVASLLLVKPFAHVGLASAISIAAWVNAGLLLVILYRQRVYQPLSGWTTYLLKLIIATVVMAMVIGWGAGDNDQWLTYSLSQRAGQLILWVSLGAVAYFVMLRVLGLHPRQLLFKAADSEQL